ncbi:hypothetical protein AB1N83_002939 [Pleurotus pulmonarius]
MPQTLEGFYDNQPDVRVHPSDIRLARERHNADCSQTRKLPVEILIEIFRILGALNYGREHLYPHLKWVGCVTHVCRSWRDIALNEPLLWTDFVNRVHPNWAPEIFARSKSAPLRVHHGELIRVPDFVIEEIVRSPERLKELHIDSYKASSILRRMVKPAPFLESLVVVDDSRIKFPPNFLGGIAPRLRFVSCWELPVKASWSANLRSLKHYGPLHSHASWLSKLTSLHLGRYAAPRDFNINGIFSILENAPLLQRLTFATSSYVDDRPCSRSTPLRLRHLCDITADLEAKPGMAKLFDHLEVDNIKRLRTFWPRRFENNITLEHVRDFVNRCYHGDRLQRSEHDLKTRRCICWTEAGQKFEDL